MATVKHVSYAGITLPLPTPYFENLISQVKPYTFTDFDGWNYDQPSFLTNRLPTPQIPKPPHLNLGTLTWPTGATRPAWFHGVVNTNQLMQIRTAIADPMTPQDLVMFDGRTIPEAKRITASMYFLPPRPLAQLGKRYNDSWLITLTDQRFYWYFKRGVIATQPISWTDLYGQLAAILGISINVETLNPFYLSPSKKWVGYYAPPSVVLDSVATQIGQRIVVGLDGTVSTKNWETAQAESDLQTTDFHVIGGGLLDTSDIGRYVPASINNLFLDTSTTPNPIAPHVVNKTLVSTTIATYGTQTGLTGTSQILYGDTTYDGTNSSALDAYAAAQTQDWYGWRLADVDTTFPGIEPWVPTGFEDQIEWTIQLRESSLLDIESGQATTDGPAPFASTYVRRGPWSDFTSGYYPPTNSDISGSVFSTFARLTTTSGGKWKWIPQGLNPAGVYIDTGAEATGFNSVPLTIDGSNYCDLFSGLRVRMFQSLTNDTLGQPQYEFLPIACANATGGSGGSVAGCGWIAGMATGWCFHATVLNAFGQCACIDTSQFFDLRWTATNTWTAQSWNCTSDVWENQNFRYCSGEGALVVSIDTDAEIAMTISGSRLSWNSCANYSAIFNGGPRSNVAFCTGAYPAVGQECTPNTFQVMIQCECCSIDGWQGPGWYCILDTGTDCDDPDKTVVIVFLDEEDRCNTEIVICSCRFATRVLAEAACGGTIVACCPSDPIPTRLYAHFSAGTGAFACLDGTSVPLDNPIPQIPSCDDGPGNGWSFNLHPVGLCCDLLDVPGCGGKIQTSITLCCTGGSWGLFINDPDPTCFGGGETCPFDFQMSGANSGTPSSIVCNPFSITFLTYGLDSFFPSSTSGTATIVINTIP